MFYFGRLARTILSVAILVVVVLVFDVPAQASIVPSISAANFGNQTVGTASAPLTITLTNTGTGPSTIFNIFSFPTVFSYSGLSLPMTLSAGQSVVATVTFAPLAPAAYSGALIVANDSGQTAFVALNGMGIAAQAGNPGQPSEPATLLLNASLAALSLGDVNLSTLTTQSVTLTNAGNSDVTITNVSISGPGFTLGGSTTGSVVSTGLILSPGQTATLIVTFTPASAGSVTGSIIVTSNAANSPNIITLSGNGVTPVAHSVLLSWTPSTSAVIGYNVYASTVSGTAYTVLNSSPVAGPSYTDTNVQAGQIYYFVVTSVDADNVESDFSSEVSATVP